MSGSELDEIAALVGRILPDPNGFVQRLLDQAVTRWGGPVPGAPGGEPIEASARLRADGGDEPDGRSAQLVGMSSLLAAALGACDCWGLQPRCPACDGAGSSGWVDPDLELFQEFVGPAAARLTASGFDDDPTPDGPSLYDDQRPNNPSAAADTDRCADTEAAVDLASEAERHTAAPTGEPPPDGPERYNPTYRTRRGVPA